MSLSEALITGLTTTVVGLSIVFLVLFILMVVLKVFEKIFSKPQDNKKPDEAKVSAVQVAPAKEVAEDEDELVAVLTAAIAASLNTSTYNLRIKSYRRVQNSAPEWNRAGLKDTINQRLN